MSTVADRYYKIEADLRIKDMEVAEAKKLSELITMRLGKDVDRFRIEFHNRMREILENYHSGQAKYLQGQTQLYLDILPSLSKIDTNKPNLPKVKEDVKSPALKLSITTAGASVAVDSMNDDINQLSVQESAPAPVEAPPIEPFSSTTQNVNDTADGSFDAIPMGRGEEAAAPPAAAPPPPPPPAEESNSTTSLSNWL